MIGCGPEAPEPEVRPDFSQFDSAGILLSISRNEMANAPLGWSVEPDPDLVLGRGDSASGYFHEIQGVRGTEDGGVLVVDGASRELRFYDSEARLVKRAGGPGEGPEEFGDPALVPVVGTDSLMVYDKDLTRAHILSAEGAFGRLIHPRYGRPYGARAPVGAVEFRHMLFDGSGTAGGPEAPLPDEGLVQLQQKFLWYDTATGARRTVDSVLVDHRYRVRRDGRRVERRVPFTARSYAATTADGAFISRGRPAEILEYDVEGGLRRIFRVEGFGRPVTQEMIDEFIDLRFSRRPARYGGSLNRTTWYDVYEEIGIPDTLPAFQELQLDESGWLWAQVYDFDSSGPKEWVVFDPEGRAHGTVRTPPGLEVRWIGRDAVLGVWRDQFDVEYVHRHRLTRSTTREDSTRPRG